MIFPQVMSLALLIVYMVLNGFIPANGLYGLNGYDVNNDIWVTNELSSWAAAYAVADVAAAAAEAASA